MSSSHDRTAGSGNVADLLRRAARSHPSRPALIGDGPDRTWSALDRAVDAGAAALMALGHPSGARVMVTLPTGADIVLTLFAVARAGLVAVPQPPGTSADELAAVAARTGAVLAVGEPVDGLVRLDAADLATWWHGSDHRVENGASGEDLAVLARAAGERPVMIPHRAVLAAVEGILGAPRLGLRSEDRAIQVLPLHHLAGWVTGFLPLTAVGGAAVLPQFPPDAGAAGGWIDVVLATVRAQRVTVVPAAPGLYRRLEGAANVERSLASVRLLTSGAAPLDPEDFSAIRSHTGLTVWEGYGISESASVVATSLMGAAPRPGSVGRPVPGVELRIVTEDDLDELGRVVVEPEPAPDPEPLPDVDPAATEVPETERQNDGEPEVESEGTSTGAAEPGADAEQAPADEDNASTEPTDPAAEGLVAAADDQLVDVVSDGEVGRIALRGPTLFAGYWPDGADGPDENGWFVTGDLGYLDDTGDLHLVDRAAETIGVAGFTVYPREIEDVLTGHPYVRDAAVVSAPGRVGDQVVAVLVAQRGTRPTQDDLDEYVADRLPVFKRPARYVLLDRLPRTPLGRVDRAAVRALVPDGGAIPLHSVADRTADPAPGHPDPAPGQAGGKAGPVADKAGPAATGGGVPAAPPRLPGVSSGPKRGAQDGDEDLF
ncbi:class I adenylate-forming enzyme family protein [Nakamurella alba]|nr:class I adenylate-forming enzyme family protein [Nakamurella alba]